MLASSGETQTLHDDVIKWKHFPRNWPFVRGIHRSPVNSPTQRPVTRSFDIFFDPHLNKRLNKHWWGWWFERPPRSSWRHCNGTNPWQQALAEWIITRKCRNTVANFVWDAGCQISRQLKPRTVAVVIELLFGTGQVRNEVSMWCENAAWVS